MTGQSTLAGGQDRENMKNRLRLYDSQIMTADLRPLNLQEYFAGDEILSNVTDSELPTIKVLYENGEPTIYACCMHCHRNQLKKTVLKSSCIC